MSRVASELSIIASHHQPGHGARRSAGAEAKESPFAMLLDEAGPAATPAAPDRAERSRPTAGAAESDTPDPRPSEKADTGDSAPATSPTATSDVAVTQTQAVPVADADLLVAEIAEVDQVDEEEPVPVEGLDTLQAALAVDSTPDVTADATVTGEAAPVTPAPVTVVPSTPVAATEAATETRPDGASIEQAASVEAPAAISVNAASTAESKRPADHKANAGGIAADSVRPRAPKAATEGESPATTDGATEIAPQDDDGHASARALDTGEHAAAPASRSPHQPAAAKPEMERPPLEPQVSATADKPSADVVQLVTQQHPAERSVSVSSVAAGTAHSTHSAAAPADQSAAVPIAGLALEIAGRVQSGRSRFEIRLDPPELGRIEVRLDVDRAGQVTSRLVVDKAETLDLLRRDASELERALQQAGLKTGDNGLQFTLRHQSFSGGEQDSRSAADAAQLIVSDSELTVSEPAVSGYGRLPRLGGGIDIRV